MRLSLNYRCRQRIIDASLHVLQPEEERHFLSTADDDERGEIFFEHCPEGLDQQAAYVAAKVRQCLADGVAPGEIGVFARRWNDLASCERALIDEGIPYRLARARDYRITPLTAWVEDMALWCAGGWRLGKPRMADLFSTWERLSSACRDAPTGSADLPARVELYKVLSSLRDGDMSVATWTGAIATDLGLWAMAEDPDTIPIRMRYDVRELGVMLSSLSTGALAEQTLSEFTGIETNKVVIQSLHASKGLEYSVVFMLALEKGILPQFKENEAEARRLFYVGMTRAKRHVHLLFSSFFHNAKGKRNDWGPSPFLAELWRRLQQDEA